MILPRILCILPVFWLWHPVSAQEHHLRVGTGLSGITYLGDLNEPGSGLWRVSAGGELSLEQVKSRPLGVSFHAGFGQFTEQWDNPDNQPGTRFVQTPFLHGDFRVHVRKPAGRFQPYASVGAGLLSFTPKDRDGFPLADGNYNTIIPQLPASAGMRWQVNHMIGFDLSYTWRFTPTDFLDNIGQEGSRSGFDGLHALAIGIQFDLGAGMPNQELPVQDTSLAPAIAGLPDEKASVEGVGEEVQPAINEADYDREKAMESVENEVFLYYETKSGETVDELALRFRVPPDLLRELNYLPEKTKLKKGTYLRIPHVSD